MDRKDRMIQTLAHQIAHAEVVKAELLAIIRELEEKLKEVEENGNNQATGVSEE